MAPPSQKFRQIAFWLVEGPQKAAGGLLDQAFQGLKNDLGFGPDHVVLSLRPEDLTRSEPSRLTATQTLGGAWLDSFGPGIGEITLAGHTGWRGGFLSSGEDAFYKLRNTVFANWHKKRKQAVDDGKDPNTEVTLFFSDSLDSIAVAVAPQSFTLRRSRSRPLLYMYQIRLTVLGDATAPLSLVDTIANAIADPQRFLLGQVGLLNVAGQLGDLASAVNSFASIAGTAFGAVNALSSMLGPAISAYGGLGASIFSEIAGEVSTLEGNFITGPAAALLSLGTVYAQAGASALQAVASVNQTLPASQRLVIQQLAAAFNDAACTIANCFNVGRYFRSLDDLYGASACSSTGGGRPWSPYTVSGTNPFDAMFGQAAPLVAVSLDAQAALAAMAADPLLLAQLPDGQLAGYLRAAVAGTRVLS